MDILAFESSCDETSIALVRDGKEILDQEIYSQTEIHAPFQGVVPEIASRNHLDKIFHLLDRIISPDEVQKIDAVAVTNGPGLIGSLLIGVSAAKALAYALKKPLIPVNHIDGHLYAPHLNQNIPFPVIALVASGGHTVLYHMKNHEDKTMIGSTIDDAIGEAFDKVAKMMNLGYPGGPVIDRLSRNGDPDFLNLPQLFPDTPKDKYHFSYSGLKTAVSYRLKNIPDIENHQCDIAASFQKSAVGLLLRKTANALRDYKINRLLISGGVAANSYLRDSAEKLGKQMDTEIYLSPPQLCGDNAAMIAGRAYFEKEKLAYPALLNLDAYSRIAQIKKGKRITE